ncbi:MAG: CCA tRNA nucleotidyltransferase [Roseburia sp.]|nr:CCA tRNA nucleotidyltransferase [Roseburia sp.]
MPGQIKLPQKVQYIIETLESHGYEAYAVGGCIRDSLLNRSPQDWDITTSAKPQEVKNVFKKTIDTGIQHGTVTVLLDREGFEVTTYRIDGKYEDGRHPKEVVFTPNLKEDLKRRDFTINAMAYNESQGLIDLFGGEEDLNQGIVRCVGDARARFSEDALRMMRAVRFGAQLGFSIEEETRAAIKELAPALSKISAERIQTELVKLAVSDNPQEMRTLYETGLTAVMLPEFDAMMETEQNNPHHKYTVGEHTIEAMRNVTGEKVLRLAMLFHDVAKPVCLTTDEDGIHHFHGHPLMGKDMTEKILRRLKFDNDTIERVCALVKGHDDNPPVTPRNIRRAMVRLGLNAYPDIFAVKRADILAQSGYQRQEKLEYLKEYEECYKEIIEKRECLSLKGLAVNGRDLMELGIPSGPELGEVLKKLLDIVLEEPDKNTREELLTAVKNDGIL